MGWLEWKNEQRTEPKTLLEWIKSKLPMEGTDVMPFGKYAGKLLKDLPDGYLGCILDKPWILDYPRLKAYIELRFESSSYGSLEGFFLRS